MKITQDFQLDETHFSFNDGLLNSWKKTAANLENELLISEIIPWRKKRN